LSPSGSKIGTVIRCFENHHKQHVERPFRDECAVLLEKSGVEYDQRYTFKSELGVLNMTSLAGHVPVRLDGDRVFAPVERGILQTECFGVCYETV
jgi:hypothetical protein